MKAARFLFAAIAIFSCSSVFAKGMPKETVTVVDHESLTKSYDWYMNGRSSVSCYGNTCSGVYSLPTSGTQYVQGAVLRLLRSDATIVVARCEGKVNIYASIEMVVNAINANDPNLPTVHRSCREPNLGSIVEAEFHSNTVKLFWHYAGVHRETSETYAIVGYLQPSASQATRPQPAPQQPARQIYVTPVPVISAPIESHLQGASASEGFQQAESYKASADGFSVLFPSEPQLTMNTTYTNAGSVEVHSYSTQDAQAWLYITVNGYWDKTAEWNIDGALQQAKHNFLRSNGRVIRERKISLGVYNGLEFESENNLDQRFDVRIYIVGDSLYTLWVVTPKTLPYANTIHFLDSFQLIPRINN